MASITGLQIRQELAKWDIIQLLGTATSTAGAAGYLVDATRLDAITLPSTQYDGCWVRLLGGTDGDPDGFVGRVDYLDPSNGRLYLDPAPASAIVSGTTYEVYAPGVDSDDIDRCRDKALTSVCSQWARQPITEVINGDYEDSIGASNWTGTNATLAKQSLAFPQEWVRNTLRVTNSSDNGRASSQSIYCRPGQEFYLYVPVSARTGTAEIVVRDITNGADITLSGTATQAVGRGWTAFEVRGQIPTSCYEIQIWLRGLLSTAIIEWGPVHFTWSPTKRIGLPDRIPSRDYVGPVFRLDYAMNLNNTNYWGGEKMEEISGVNRNSIGDSVSLEFTSLLGEFPYFFSERIFYSALSTDYQTAAQRIVGDAATTTCPLDYVVAATAKLLAELYLLKRVGEKEFWAATLVRAMTDLSKYEKRFGPKVEPIKEQRSNLYIPTIRV